MIEADPEPALAAAPNGADHVTGCAGRCRRPTSADGRTGRERSRPAAAPGLVEPLGPLTLPGGSPQPGLRPRRRRAAELSGLASVPRVALNHAAQPVCRPRPRRPRRRQRTSAQSDAPRAGSKSTPGVSATPVSSSSRRQSSTESSVKAADVEIEVERAVGRRHPRQADLGQALPAGAPGCGGSARSVAPARPGRPWRRAPHAGPPSERR